MQGFQDHDKGLIPLSTYNRDSMNPKSDGFESPIELFFWCTREGGQISRCPESVTSLINGLDYYFVEVILNDKSQRTIQAFGNDADILYKTVMKIKSQQDLV